MKKPKIVITKLPKWSYAQWFLLGLYELKRRGDISLSFRLGLIDRLSLYIDNYYAFGVGQRYMSGHDTFCVEGYMQDGNKRKWFCIDHQDSPYLFDSGLLDKVSIYFKMQCPKEFDERGFRLAEGVYAPWTDHQHIDSSVLIPQRGKRKPLTNLFSNIEKVRPLMVGPRHLAYGNGYKALHHGLLHDLNLDCPEATEKMMCYFGNSLGPKPSPESNIADICDYNWESDIMALWKGEIEHPNEKRSKANKILESMGNGYDARLIRDGHSDGSADSVRKDLVIPLEKFCDHISHYQYNLNISGYRLSIPNRFIESFLVGTAIVTDKLAVKWYKPFDSEVFETVEMGYAKDKDVDWDKFRSDITNLPVVSKKEVFAAFQSKWAPEKVAEYIITELTNAR